MVKTKQEEKISVDENRFNKNIEEHIERINIRCRKCFMVDSYLPDEKTCKHCGAIIYRVDIY